MESVAVCLMVISPTGKESVALLVIVTGKMSLVVGTPSVIVTPSSCVMSAGAVISGDVVSVIVIT